MSETVKRTMVVFGSTLGDEITAVHALAMMAFENIATVTDFNVALNGSASFAILSNGSGRGWQRDREWVEAANKIRIHILQAETKYTDYDYVLAYMFEDGHVEVSTRRSDINAIKAEQKMQESIVNVGDLNEFNVLLRPGTAPHDPIRNEDDKSSARRNVLISTLGNINAKARKI
jgi:hypothetical protein